MSAYTKPILELICRRPGIRMVEIADLVDCEPDMVQPAIQSEIDAGNIHVEKVTAPNGRPANAFIPSPDLVQKYAPKTERPAETSASQIEQLSNVGKVEMMAAAAEAPTKVKRAMAFLQTNGKATTAELRQVMGIGEKAQPRAYLATQIRKGMVVFQDDMWMPGTGAPDEAREQRRRELPVLETVSTPAAAAPADAIDQTFACALWSDGELMMVRDGNELAVLSKEETALLRRYLGSLPQLEAA
jgi:hypothetical protein